jgi:hypothetical protein
MEKLIKCTCNYCHKEFNKPLREYTRKIKKETLFYCSLTCSAKENNKNRDISYLKQYSNKGKNIKHNPFKFYIKICKQRKYEFDLTLEYLKIIWDNQKGICPYSKVKLYLNTHSKLKINKDIRYMASLDRIDSNKGYIQGNVQFVSVAINLMKQSMTHDDTFEFLQIIKNNI